MIGLSSFNNFAKGLKASKLGTVAGLAFQPISESGEEVYQGFASQEATESVKGDVEFFGEGSGERIVDYATSEEGKEAAFLGAAMGVLFDAGSTYTMSLNGIGDFVRVPFIDDPAKFQQNPAAILVRSTGATSLAVVDILITLGSGI